jgi:Mg2+-importing ATPase
MGQVARALGARDRLSGTDQSEVGLSSAEAERRFAEFGPNEPVPAKIAGPLFQFLRFCANPLVLILLVASVTSAFLGQVIDAIIIAAMIVLSVVLNFIQAYRSEKAVVRLREQVAPTATVKRDGNWIELPRRQLAPGDVVRLSAGDLVPADARLLQSQDLHVQQAALTGESMPVEKCVGEGEADATGATRPDLVFLGTSVVSGTATAVVVATGPRTSFGDIAARLSERPPETEFDRGTRQFGILIMKTVFFLVLFILVVSVGMHRNALESLLFAVALAVGLTPEFLPMITTVTLSMGALRMARRKVIVKHLDAIENLGSIDLLCSDKTGTLTSGEMELDSSLDPLGEPSERPLQLGYLNSCFESGIKSPLDVSILKCPQPPNVEKCEKTDEIPFDFERRRLSVVVRTNSACMIKARRRECWPYALRSRSVANVARWEVKNASDVLKRSAGSARTVCGSSQWPIGRLIAPRAGIVRMSVTWRLRDSSRSLIRRLKELRIRSPRCGRMASESRFSQATTNW